ncbi:MAG: AbrB/MazE/SpoVT family DNA-binding domain-containing protein [Candidatus Thermoplasmatota archaeon]
MSDVEVRAKLLEWGNSYGIRLSKDDVQRFGLRPNHEVRIRLEINGEPLRVKDLPSFDLQGAADHHDEIFAESADER